MPLEGIKVDMHVVGSFGIPYMRVNIIRDDVPQRFLAPLDLDFQLG